MANDMGNTVDMLKDLLNSPGAGEKLNHCWAHLWGMGKRPALLPPTCLALSLEKAEKTDGAMPDIPPGIPVDSMLKIAQAYQQISKKDDPRVNLLKAIKPYVRSSRSESVDTAIKLLGLMRLAPLFGGFKGCFIGNR